MRRLLQRQEETWVESSRTVGVSVQRTQASSQPYYPRKRSKRSSLMTTILSSSKRSIIVKTGYMWDQQLLALPTSI